jgi:hypothetical protein
MGEAQHSTACTARHAKCVAFASIHHSIVTGKTCCRTPASVSAIDKNTVVRSWIQSCGYSVYNYAQIILVKRAHRRKCSTTDSPVSFRAYEAALPQSCARPLHWPPGSPGAGCQTAAPLLQSQQQRIRCSSINRRTQATADSTQVGEQANRMAPQGVLTSVCPRACTNCCQPERSLARTGSSHSLV